MKETYRPSELKKLKHARVFEPQTGEQSVVPVQQRVVEFAEEVQGTIYTGIHSESDWSRTHWWEKGWHLVNRTWEYAVVW